MRKPIFVCPLQPEAQLALEASLRSPQAFTLRRAQIVLASSRGKRASAIAHDLGCSADTVTDAINAFNQRGLAALKPGSTRNHTVRTVVTGSREQFVAVLHQSPRDLGQETSLWTLDLLAQLSVTQGLASRPVSAEAIRKAVRRLRISWQRAKRWLESPDPAYARKKGSGTGS